MKKSIVLVVAVVAIGSGTRDARAGAREINHQERCEDELHQRSETSWIGITKELAKERHMWALRCVPNFRQAAVDMAEDMGMVWCFTNLDQPGVIAPWRRDAPCDNYRVFTTCPLGCFAADQRVLFGKEWMTLEEADRSGKTTFSGLADGASPFNIDISRELEIAYIAAGEEKQPLIRFTLAGGKSIRVTREHPMIDQFGTVVPAAAVELGTMLLTMEGPREVTRIDHAVDARKVWHIFPQSKAPRDNVVFAEGVATGSLRFQSVWADEASRLLLRQELSDETLETLTD